MSVADTIFALSTAPGRAGVAVVRLSGAAAGGALEALLGRDRPAPRKATLARLRDPGSGAPIDEGLVLWFPGPRSFTGEDMAELHLHGGPAVVAAALDALSRVPGLRLAEPGEFTHRAFDAGKLDLTEVEGLADLIDAQTDAQRRQALRQMEGALSRIIEAWRDALTRALAHLEATIDFPDEDLPDGLPGTVGDAVTGVAGDIGRHLDDARRGERLRDGLHIAILGPPNAGKSSLLNAIARRDVAIVAETAGTTRDVIEVHLDLAGYPVTLLDTAGLRTLETRVGDPVEVEGMRRARRRAASADLKLAVFDLPNWTEPDRATVDLIDDDTLIVLNKVDLASGDYATRLGNRTVQPVSAKTGEGLSALLDRLAEEVAGRLDVGGEAPGVTRARHRLALEDCRAALARFERARLPELAAEDLRLALRALGRITGEVDVEDLLDIIFRDFCIGK